MAEILEFTGITTIPEDPTATLEKAKAWGLEQVVICGWNKDGAFVFGGSHSEVAECVLLLEMAKLRFLQSAAS